MNLQRSTKLLIRIFLIVFLVELVIVMAIVMVGWWAGWSTAEQFKEAIQIAGILQIGFGFLGIKGNWEVTRSFEYQYSMSATSKDSWERTQQTLLDFAQSYAFMLVMFLAGGLSLIIGWLM